MCFHPCDKLSSKNEFHQHVKDIKVMKFYQRHNFFESHDFDHDDEL